MSLIITVMGLFSFTASSKPVMPEWVKVESPMTQNTGNSPITVIISDNFTTAMTGGQDSAGLNKYEAICLALGVEREHLHLVVPIPKNMEQIKNIIRKEMMYKGVSVIIAQRECMQTLARKLRSQKKEKDN